MASLVRTKHLQQALDRVMTGGLNEEVLSWRWFNHLYMDQVEVQIEVLAGRLAVRFDSDAANKAIFDSTTTSPVVISTVGLGVGPHVIRIVSLEPTSTFALIEVYNFQIERR